MNVPQKRGNSFLTGVIICVLSVLLLFLVFTFAWELPVSSDKLKELSVGMTTNQVEQILGKPTMDLGRVSNEPGKIIHYWWYERSLHWRDVCVSFDSQDRYIGFQITSGGF